MTPRRLHAVLGAVLWVTAGCTQMRPVPPPPALLSGDISRAQSAACRIGPQDGRPATAAAIGGSYEVADRGVGGTGGGGALPPLLPAAPPRPTAPVDRGIGGTGPGNADRSPVTTGIVGVITGFASVCMNRLEVGYGTDTNFADDTAGAIDGRTLRAGQLAVVTADSEAGGLQARSVVLRHEVVGPVDLVAADGMIVVAGQPVRLTNQTRGAGVVAGAWVAVSGLRDPSDVIVATRIDPAPMGVAFVHGLLQHDDGNARIGRLRLHLPRSLELPPDGAVIASGLLLDGVLYVSALAADPAAEDPAAAFDPTISNFVVESRIDLGVDDGRDDGSGTGGGVFVVQLQRVADGTLRRVAVRHSGLGYAALAAGVSVAHGPLFHLRPTVASIGRQDATPIRARRDEPAPMPGGRGRNGTGTRRGGMVGRGAGEDRRGGRPQGWWGPRATEPSVGPGSAPPGGPPGH